MSKRKSVRFRDRKRKRERLTSHERANMRRRQKDVPQVEIAFASTMNELDEMALRAFNDILKVI